MPNVYNPSAALGQGQSFNQNSYTPTPDVSLKNTLSGTNSQLPVGSPSVSPTTPTTPVTAKIPTATSGVATPYSTNFGKATKIAKAIII